MNIIIPDTETNGRGKGTVNYFPSPRTIPSDSAGGFWKELHTFPDLPTMGEEIHKEFEKIYIPTPHTGEVERIVIPATKRIVEVLESAINLLDEVLEVYDDEIERINTFSLFEEKIKSLWGLREEANKNFVDVLVLLEVAVRNSHYQNYQKNQYQSIKMLLGKIKVVYITPQQAKECRKLLMDNGIDLFSPIRDWENYTVEIKKNNATE